jgi:hypothetical protein
MPNEMIKRKVYCQMWLKSKGKCQERLSTSRKHENTHKRYNGVSVTKEVSKKQKDPNKDY